MFGLFKKDGEKNNFPIPVDEEQRKWLEHAFMYLFYQFDADKFHDRDVLIPENFSKYKFNGDKNEVEHLAKQIAEIMEINPDKIQLEYFIGGMEEFRHDEEVLNPGGEYLDRAENGKYIIALSEELLKHPEDLIATIAHEYGHIKLLGEKRLDFNDEYLTDVVPLLFGLGIFNANSSFKFYGWTYSKMGYLTQMDWGYLLALFAFVKEDDSPSWLVYLNKTLQKDFEQSINFMINNEEVIFKHLREDSEDT